MKLNELRSLVDESYEEVLKEIASVSSLVKGKLYNWTMGAIPLTVRYIGKRTEFPEIKVGSSVGKGYIFQWEDGRYMEVGPITIFQHIREIEPDEMDEPDEREDSKYDGYVSADWGGNPDLYEAYKKGYKDAHKKYKILAEAYKKLKK